jgi:hypothetical protein
MTQLVGKTALQMEPQYNEMLHNLKHYFLWMGVTKLCLSFRINLLHWTNVYY